MGMTNKEVIKEIMKKKHLNIFKRFWYVIHVRKIKKATEFWNLFFEYLENPPPDLYDNE